MHRLTALSVTLLLTGCLQPLDPDAVGGLTEAERYQQDQTLYSQTVSEAEARRSQFLGEKADEHQAIGNRLFWLEYPTISATLHSYDSATGSKVNYGFPPGDAANFRASSQLIATA